MNTTTAQPGSQPAHQPDHHSTAWGSHMTDRYFWGMPTTDTDTNALEAALRDRAHDVAAGKYAAASFANEALDRVTKRSTQLLQVNVLFMLLVMWLLSRPAMEQTAMFTSFNRWAFGLALVSCVFLLTNLRLVVGSKAEHAYGNPHSAYTFAMGIYKGRAWRYTVAHVLSLAAFVVTLISVSPFR